MTTRTSCPARSSRAAIPDRLGDVPTEWYKKILRNRAAAADEHGRAVHARSSPIRSAEDRQRLGTVLHLASLRHPAEQPVRHQALRPGGEARRGGETWDWLTNREGMLRYWRGGVEENKDLDCIWPVGMRGTDDTGYTFPKDMPEAEQSTHLQGGHRASRCKMTKEPFRPESNRRCSTSRSTPRCCRSTRPARCEVPRGRHHRLAGRQRRQHARAADEARTSGSTASTTTSRTSASR